MTYEIWLSDEYGWFNRGVAHLEDGRKLELCAMLHTATYGKDSLLIDDEENFTYDRYPLRWYISGKGLEFYCVDKDAPDVVLFHNESNQSVQIGNMAAIPPGANARVDLRLGSMSVWRNEDEDKPAPKILRNRAKCLICGEILESTHRHDFKTCSCGNLSVDGGHDYIRRGFEDRCAFEELSEYRSASMPGEDPDVLR